MSVAIDLFSNTSVDVVPSFGQSSRGERFDIDLVKRLASDGSVVSSDDNSVFDGFQSPDKLGVVKAPSSVERNVSGWVSISQSWEGRVIANNPPEKEFVAVISDKTHSENPDEEVVIGYESVLPSDIELIAEGAVFFWNVGAYRQRVDSSGKIGPSKNKYELRFRRLPPLSPDRLREIQDLSKRLSSLIHGN